MAMEISNSRATGEPAFLELPAQQAAEAPAWFRAKPPLSEQPEGQPARRRAKTPIIAADDGPLRPLTWKQRLAVWFTASALTGYGVSLMVHFVALAIMAIVAVTGMQGDDNVNTMFSMSDRETVEFEEIGDSVIEQGGRKTELTNPIEIVQAESNEPTLQPMQDPSELFQGQGDGEGNSEGSGIDLGPGFFKMPESGKAVTKGSFTVWTVPEDPAVGENYRIVIQIRLPSDEKLTRYSPRKDLSGIVIGTDAYRQMIPGPGVPRITPVEDHHTQVVIFVPAATYQLVEDTIKVRSRLLREEQTLKIVF